MKVKKRISAKDGIALLSLLLLTLGCPPAVQEVRKPEKDTGVSPAKKSYDICFQYLKNRMWDDAIVNCEKAIEESLTYVDAYLGLAQAYDGKEEYGLEVETYERGIAVLPEETRLYYGLGAILTKLRRYEEAMGQYWKVLEIKPEDSYAFYGVGYVYEKERGEGALDSAIVYYEKALKRDPGNLSARFGLARVCIAAGQAGKAVEQCIVVAEAYPEDLEVRITLGDAYFELGNFEEAAKHYQYVVSKTPTHFSARLKLGKTFEKTKRYKDAEAEYLAVADLKPDNPQPLLHLANLYLEMKDFRSAERALRKVLTLDPRNAPAHFLMGEVYLERKNWDEAEHEYRAAAELDSVYRESVDNRLKIIKVRREKEREEKEGW